MDTAARLDHEADSLEADPAYEPAYQAELDEWRGRVDTIRSTPAVDLAALTEERDAVRAGRSAASGALSKAQSDLLFAQAFVDAIEAEIADLEAEIAAGGGGSSEVEVDAEIAQLRADLSAHPAASIRVVPWSMATSSPSALQTWLNGLPNGTAARPTVAHLGGRQYLWDQPADAEVGIELVTRSHLHIDMWGSTIRAPYMTRATMAAATTTPHFEKARMFVFSGGTNLAVRRGTLRGANTNHLPGVFIQQKPPTTAANQNGNAATVDVATNTFTTATPHQFTVGTTVQFLANVSNWTTPGNWATRTSEGVPGGLVEGNAQHGRGPSYWVFAPTATTFKVAASLTNALAGVAVDVTDSGPPGGFNVRLNYHETGHGIAATGVQGFVVEDMDIEQVYGDAVYTHARSGIPIRDVHLFGGRYRGGRMAFSTEWCEGLRIEGKRASGQRIFLHAFRSAIDLEPAAALSKITDVYIDYGDVRYGLNAVAASSEATPAALPAGYDMARYIAEERMQVSRVRVNDLTNSGGNMALHFGRQLIGGQLTSPRRSDLVITNISWNRSGAMGSAANQTLVNIFGYDRVVIAGFVGSYSAQSSAQYAANLRCCTGLHIPADMNVGGTAADALYDNNGGTVYNPALAAPVNGPYGAAPDWVGPYGAPPLT